MKLKHRIALVNTLTGLAMATATFAPTLAHADGGSPAPSCAVAVCNIPAEIEKLRAEPQGQRFQEIVDLRANYKNEAKPAVLQNLLDFANQAGALFTQLNEADWLIREAKNLANDVLLKLAKFSDLQPGVLAGYYSQLNGETARFETITYWEAKIGDYEDQNQLLALGAFFKAAEQISTRAQDPDYLAREALHSEDLVTQRLVEIYPYFEGVYQIEVGCAGAGVANPACGTLPVDRLVIMNSLSDDGIIISLVNHGAGQAEYRFTNALITDAGSTIEAVGQPTGAVSKLHLELARETGELKGWLQSGDSVSSLQIHGRILQTPASVFADQEKNSTAAPIPLDMLTHEYHGTFDDSAFSLLIRPIDETHIGASITFDSMPTEPLRFQTVHYFPKRGIMVLIAGVNNGGLLKVVVEFRGDTSQVSGVAFGSLDGGTHSLQATPVIQPAP